MPIVPHSANTSLVIVFTMHLLAAIPNAGPFMEFSIESREGAQGLFAPTPEARDGQVAFPEGPGWGVTICESWLEKAQHAVSEG